MKLRMTLAALEPRLAIVDRDGDEASPDAVRERLLEEFRAGKLHRLDFAATTWTDGPNRNHYEFPAAELESFAGSFKGRPFLKDHSASQDARGGTILDSRLVELPDGRKGIRQRIEAVKPWAIEGVLDKTVDSFSIGWNPEAYDCTVCATSILECKHGPFKLGKVDKDTGKTVGILFRGIAGSETSAVTHPAAPGTALDEVMAQLATMSQKWKNASGISPEHDEEARMKEKVLSLLGLPANTAEPEALIALEARLMAPQKAGIPKSLCIALGLSESASETEVIGKAVAMTAPGAFVARTEHEKLVAELAGMKAEKRVEAALAAGKLSPVMTEWATKLAKENPEGFDSFIEAAPKIVPLPSSGTAPPSFPADPKGKPGLSADELIGARAFGMTAEEYRAAQAEVAKYDSRLSEIQR